MTALNELLDRVNNKKAVVGVLGLGRVGLPLASVFASKGFSSLGFDTDLNRVDSIKKGVCPFFDPILQENLEKSLKLGNLLVSSEFKKINGCDIIFVTVGTPTTENTVDYSQLYDALKQIIKVHLSGKMIILRSTMPVNTTKDIIIPFIEFNTTLKVGIDFAIAVCPERILEGQAVTEIENLPEIVGVMDKLSYDIASSLFLQINPKKDILKTSLSGAELSKLFTNIYRYISFALSNEFAIWAERYNLNVHELIKIVNYNYPRANIPIPGFAGGPCLSKDGILLDNNTTFSTIVSTAWKVNESIPMYVVNNLKNIIGNLFGKKIAVLGLSFKSGSDDLRNSPSVKLVEILCSLGANTLVHDPYVKSTLPLSEVLKKPDVIDIATNHKEFKNIIPNIQKSGCTIVYDVWGIFDKNDFSNIDYYVFGKGNN